MAGRARCGSPIADRRTLFVATAPDFEPEERRASRNGRIEALRVRQRGVWQLDSVGAARWRVSIRTCPSFPSFAATV
jgi:hypothetical protein